MTDDVLRAMADRWEADAEFIERSRAGTRVRRGVAAEVLRACASEVRVAALGFPGHGYTCGICPWGRADQPRSAAAYDDHMAAEHPDAPPGTREGWPQALGQSYSGLRR